MKELYYPTRIFYRGFFITLTVLLLGSVANAAPLTYSGATFLYLSTPAVTFLVATSSVADQVVVNAGTVAVTMSSATGGTLTLTSTSTDFTIATVGSGGTATQSCLTGSIAQVVFSQSSASSTYTVTPTASRCTISSSGGSSGTASGVPPAPTLTQGGGGVGTWSPITTTSTASSSTTPASSSTASLQAQLTALLAQLANLQKLAGQTTAGNGGAGGSHILTKNLYSGLVDPEVQLLQIFLNTHGFVIAKSGPGSPGNETKKFGGLTRIAVVKFQEAYKDKILTPAGLTKGNGVVGANTRATINSLGN